MMYASFARALMKEKECKDDDGPGAGKNRQDKIGSSDGPKIVAGLRSPKLG